MITIEELKKFTDIKQAIEYSESFYPKLPNVPLKPTLKSNPSISEATDFVESLRLYETVVIEYNTVCNKYIEERKEIQNIIISYIKEVSGLNEIDEKYHKEIINRTDFIYAKIHSFYRNIYTLYEILIKEIEEFKTNDIISVQQFIDAQILIKKYLKQKLSEEKILGRSNTTSITESDFGVHVTHRCFEHGCKYGDPECPVELGIVDQEYECEQCRDDRNENIFYFTI